MAAIHVVVCLIAALQAAATPSDHYFTFLFIDLLQNESFLLGWFVALTTYSTILRGVVGICGVGLLVSMCRASNFEYARFMPVVLFLLTVIGVGCGAFLRLIGMTLESASGRSRDAPRVQFTLKHLMLVTTATCWLLYFFREHQHSIDGVLVPISVHIAFPTMVVTGLATLILSNDNPPHLGILGTLVLAVAGVLALVTIDNSDRHHIFFWPGREAYLWLAETPLHMLLAMCLFRWIGLRSVWQPFNPPTP